MNVRLFVALDPPDPVRRRLGGVQASLRDAAGPHAGSIRWVPADRLHLTLQFLGAVPEERVEAVRRAVEEAAAASRPLRLVVRGAGAFPAPRRARVVWAGVEGEAGALAALAAALGSGLAPLGFPADGRPLSPHVTLGRSREAGGAHGLGGALAAVTAGEPFPWRVEELVLFHSHLGAGGARYEALLRARLGGVAGGPTP